MIQQTLEPEAFNEPPVGASPPANTVLAQGGLPTQGEGAGPMTEPELLDLMRKHCQKSWQATRWLLEIQFPERYEKRKGKGKSPSEPSVGELLDAVIGVLAEEIGDEVLRGRIEARLDKLSAQGFAATSVPATQPPKPDNIIQQPASDQSEQPPSVDDASSSEPDEPDFPQPAATETLSEDSPSQCASVAPASVVRPIEVQPIARPAKKPPQTFQEEARMRWLRRREAENKRLKKLRNHDRKKQCQQRVHAKRVKRARARPG